MNILNNLKTALLVTSIMLLPTVGYAMNQEPDQGRNVGRNFQPQAPEQELKKAMDEAAKRAAESNKPVPLYRDIDQYNILPR